MPTQTEQRAELSHERILDAAQEVIDAEGESALTFRRLGTQLDADPTAAYRYFKSKDDLLLALGDRLLGEAMDQLSPGRPGGATSPSSRTTCATPSSATRGSPS